MPVGAGSIKRVAKAAGTEMAKEKVLAKEVVAVASKEVKGTEQKGTKTASKKSASKTTTSTRALASKVKATANKTATQIDVKEADDVREYNKVCHITEELPIYLL